MAIPLDNELPRDLEKATQNISIQKLNEENFTISSPKIDLDFGDAIEFTATIQKQVLRIDVGKRMHQAIMDIDAPAFDEIKNEAQQIGTLLEHERPRKLLQLLRRCVGYPYTWVLEELSQSDTAKHLWATQTLNDGSAKISECLTNGLAKCDQFASLLLFLGNEAGLQGTIATYAPTRVPEENMVNIIHPETGQQLFKSVALGEPVHAGHAWVEFLMADGSWLPVDPATQLVGDNPQNLTAFQDANYQAFLSASFLDNGLPTELYFDFNRLRMKPGQPSQTGTIRITPITMRELDGTETQNSYHGPINCSVTTRPEIILNDLPISLKNLSVK